MLDGQKLTSLNGIKQISNRQSLQSSPQSDRQLTTDRIINSLNQQLEKQSQINKIAAANQQLILQNQKPQKQGNLSSEHKRSASSYLLNQPYASTNPAPFVSEGPSSQSKNQNNFPSSHASSHVQSSANSRKQSAQAQYQSGVHQEQQSLKQSQQANLDSIYLQCIERSKQLLNKNDFLLKQIKLNIETEYEQARSGQQPPSKDKYQYFSNPPSPKQRASLEDAKGNQFIQPFNADLSAGSQQLNPMVQKQLQINTKFPQTMRNYHPTPSYSNLLGSQTQKSTNNSPSRYTAAQQLTRQPFQFSINQSAVYNNQMPASQANVSSPTYLQAQQSQVLTNSQQQFFSPKNMLPVYEGEKKNGLKHGKGKYTYPNGTVYEGEFCNDKR